MEGRALSARLGAGMSLGTRALIAVALTVGFYVLALGLGLALVVVGPVVAVRAHGAHLWLTVATAGAGLTILRAVVPPRSSFRPPGPEITAAGQPELHALLGEVAREAGERPADRVYLDLRVNAAVLQHRRRRVLLLGLPLLATLDTDGIRAIVAHEYGHYRSGDTRFAAWIWRTRAAVLNAIYALAARPSGFRRVLRVPFEAYAKLFLRITNAISRRAEFIADQVSASIAGPETMGLALRRLVAVREVYGGYWRRHVAPMLDAERLPPIGDGFAAMTAHAKLAATLDDIVRSDIDSHEPDPYDSHPTLRRRLEALGVRVDSAAPPPLDKVAISLVRNLPAVERELLCTRFGDAVASFEPIAWRDAGPVQVAHLRRIVESFRTTLPYNVSVQNAGALASDPTKTLLSALRKNAPGMTDDEARLGALEVVAGMVVVAAADAGAIVTAMPGEQVTVALDGYGSLQPWAALEAAVRDPAKAIAWVRDPVVIGLSEQLM